MPAHLSKLLRFCLLSSLLTLTAARTYSQTLTITPAVAPVDQPIAITATGLQPGEEVTLKSELDDGAGHGWSAEAKFTADSSGNLDLTKTAPLKGSYKGISAMGLVWSMKPTGDARIYQAPRDLGPQTIRFTLHSKTGSATAQLQQIVLPQDVRLIQLKGALHGVLFVPPADAPIPGIAGPLTPAATNTNTKISVTQPPFAPPLGPAPQLGPTPAKSSRLRPALLVVGGSEGGTPMRRAAWFASHGYVALALAYFNVPGLPQQLRDIPLEYFGEAISWLSERPEVDSQRIGVVGTSRGGELALQLGSMYPRLHAVVAFVPASVRVQACCDGAGGPAWTWRGLGLNYVMGNSLRNMGFDLSVQYARIPAEITQGPILLISGQSDGIWPSSEMTASIESHLKSGHVSFKYTVERLDYPHAGHRAGAPEIDPTWHGELRHPISGRTEDLGGTPEGDAASGLDAGPRILSFLGHALGSAANSTAGQ